jgi:hypothetical protein
MTDAWPERHQDLNLFRAMIEDAEHVEREHRATFPEGVRPFPPRSEWMRRILAAMAQDAARLDWLDSQCENDVAEDGYGGQELVGHIWCIKAQRADVRSAIDALMADAALSTTTGGGGRMNNDDLLIPKKSPSAGTPEPDLTALSDEQLDAHLGNTVADLTLAYKYEHNAHLRPAIEAHLDKCNDEVRRRAAVSVREPRAVSETSEECDDCDGRGVFFIDDKPQVCICISERLPDGGKRLQELLDAAALSSAPQGREEVSEEDIAWLEQVSSKPSIIAPRARRILAALRPAPSSEPEKL